MRVNVKKELPKAFLGKKSPLKRYYYARGARGKWHRVDRILRGMRWNYYLYYGKVTPMTSMMLPPALPPIVKGLMREQSIRKEKELIASNPVVKSMALKFREPKQRIDHVQPLTAVHQVIDDAPRPGKIHSEKARTENHEVQLVPSVRENRVENPKTTRDQAPANIQLTEHRTEEIFVPKTEVNADSIRISRIRAEPVAIQHKPEMTIDPPRIRTKFLHRETSIESIIKPQEIMMKNPVPEFIAPAAEIRDRPPAKARKTARVKVQRTAPPKNISPRRERKADKISVIEYRSNDPKPDLPRIQNVKNRTVGYYSYAKRRELQLKLAQGAESVPPEI